MRSTSAFLCAALAAAASDVSDEPRNSVTSSDARRRLDNPGCINNPNWKTLRDPPRGCAWVMDGDFFRERCGVEGSYDWPNKGDKALAQEACESYCRGCPPLPPLEDEDDPTWFKKNDPSKDCKWVGANPNLIASRCLVKSDKVVLAAEACIKTCGSFREPEDCLDDPEWHKEGDPSKDCIWASRFSNRLAVIGEDQRTGYQACPVAARTCRMTDCPGDSETWHKKNDKSKDCAWVSEKPALRCTVKNDRAVLAAEACLQTCDACRTRCEDVPGWHKQGDPAKDCTWVSRFTNRLAVLGEDRTYAWQSCRKSSRTCDLLHMNGEGL